MFDHWFFSRPMVHLRALYEVAFVTLCGLLGFLLLPMVRALHQIAFDPKLPSVSLYDTVSNGQLFPYCFGMVGGLLWLSSQEFRGKGVPLRPIVNILIWGMSATCVVVYAIQPDLNHRLPDEIVELSMVILAAFVFLNYYLTVIREIPMPDVPRQLQSESNDMVERAKHRRRGGQ